MSTIVVVDDEIGIRELLRDALASDGHEAFAVSSGGDALELMRTVTPDLCIVDVNMPNMNGFELLDQLRSSDDELPVLLLSARDAANDVELGLRLGADDYVRKPFGVSELLLRVSAILRRSKGSGIAESNEILTCGALKLEQASHVVSVNGAEIDLSATEFRLLEVLLTNLNRVCTRSMLLEKVWGIDFDSHTSVLDTYVSYVRRKVHTSDFEPIKTVRGVGFKIVAPE